MDSAQTHSSFPTGHHVQNLYICIQTHNLSLNPCASMHKEEVHIIFNLLSDFTQTLAVASPNPSDCQTVSPFDIALLNYSPNLKSF